MLDNFFEKLQFARFVNNWKDKKEQFIIFILIAVATYGFELFNFNLTIDEELGAIGALPPTSWIIEGRWGMCLLQSLILPNPIVPFVPLGIALFFHILSIFLLLDAWDVKPLWWRVLAGSLMLTYPGWAYVYVFSNLNYGIGIGLFMLSLSLWLYEHIENIWYKWIAFLPATFAFALYQALLPTFFLMYLVFFVLKAKRNSTITLAHFFQFLLITVFSVSSYYIIQQACVKISNSQLTGYVQNHFLSISDILGLRLNLNMAIENAWKLYEGDTAIYTLFVFALPALLVILLIKVALDNSHKSWRYRLLEFILIACIIIFPVTPILFMQVVKLRFLMGLSFSIAALLIIGVENCKFRVFRWLVSFFAVLTILQFITSTNQLFGAAHITLQSDRVLATQIIERIEMARSQSSQPEVVNYIEVIGSFQKVPTLINPTPYNYEIIGKSIFEFNGGVSRRIVAFLKILSYDELQPLPLGRRAEFVSIAETMPDWPRMESVQVVNDTVLVKFGDYSEVQTRQICSSGMPILVENFCP